MRAFLHPTNTSPSFYYIYQGLRELDLASKSQCPSPSSQCHLVGVVVTSTALDLIPAAGGCHTEKSVLFCHFRGEGGQKKGGPEADQCPNDGICLGGHVRRPLIPAGLEGQAHWIGAGRLHGVQTPTEHRGGGVCLREPRPALRAKNLVGLGTAQVPAR